MASASLQFTLIFSFFMFLMAVLSNGIAGIKVNADIILRDMPMQDESAAADTCCAAPLADSPKIPSSALLELSQMSTADFVEKYGADESMPAQLSNGLVVIETEERMGAPAAGQQPEMKLREPFVSDIENDKMFVNLDNHPHYLMAATTDRDRESIPPNFRFSRILAVAPAVEIVQMADNARCVPGDVVVPLPKPVNHSLVIYPQCTLVKQCGGCCGDSGLVCKPTARQNIKRKASHLAYINGRLRVVDSNVVVTLEEHTECACLCRQNASDCHVNQVYEASSCRCTCRHPDKATTCGPHRVWDADRCECKCPNASGACPVGFSFEPNFYCSCLPNTGYRQNKSLPASKDFNAALPSSMSASSTTAVGQNVFIPRRKIRNG